MLCLMATFKIFQVRIQLISITYFFSRIAIFDRVKPVVFSPSWPPIWECYFKILPDVYLVMRWCSIYGPCY